MSLLPTIKLTNEVCQVITDIERAGLKIDEQVLDEVHEEFRQELLELDEWLQTKVREVVGDTPINLGSPDDKSKLIYSRAVKNKHLWKQVFNIRKDPKTGKNAYRFNLKRGMLQRKISEHSTVLRKTRAKQCPKCKGWGKYFKVRKDGAFYKKPTKCSACEGEGVIYIKEKKIAGFKVIPTNINQTTANGFKTDKHDLKKIADNVGGEVAEFLHKLVRRGAVKNYISTFAEGIKRGLMDGGFIHFKLNQINTATGRLSSSDPNFQNMPKGGKFPIRRAVVSRFEGGHILEGDYCVAPHTRILTSDLRWVTAREIKTSVSLGVYPKLIGFQEKFNSMRDIRLEESLVEGAKIVHKPCMKITTQFGEVTCSTDHQWVTRRDRKKAQWRSTLNLQVGDTISKYCDTWKEDTSNDGGWIAGFLDGEGYVFNTKVGYGQKEAGDNLLVCEKAERILKDRGFEFGKSINKTGCTRWLFKGQQQGVKVVGMYRPVRLLAKSRKMWEGKRTYGKRTKPAIIQKIEYLGEQEVVAIQTSTKTYIAEGMLSHNCQLEFRGCGFISKDPLIYEGVRNGEDVHQYTADVIGIERDPAKAHTFKPLYGGKEGTEKEKAYYNAFLKKYEGVYKWHVKIIEQVVKTGTLVLPSGREYFFGKVRRQRNGNVAEATKINNYPVQGFATADLLPIALVRCWKKMSEKALKSVICNTVHDSIVLDVHPDEVEECVEILKEAMFATKEECAKRYNIDYDMPVGIELKLGKNWLEMDEIFKGEVG